MIQILDKKILANFAPGVPLSNGKVEIVAVKHGAVTRKAIKGDRRHVQAWLNRHAK